MPRLQIEPLAVPKPALMFVGDLAWPLPTPPRFSLSPELKHVISLVPNLEGPIISLPSARRARRWLTCALWNSESVLEALAEHSAAVIIGANNHIQDYGDSAMLDTVNLLSDAGGMLMGVGPNAESARRAVVARLTDSRQVGVLAWGDPRVECAPAKKGRWGVNACSLATFERDVAALRASMETGTVVAVLHWGDELETRPRPDQRLISRRIVDAGANLVIAHHAHVVSAVEAYRHGWIVHGVGNLLMAEAQFDGIFLRYPPSARASLGVVVGGRAIQLVRFESDPVAGVVRQVSEPYEIAESWPAVDSRAPALNMGYASQYASQRATAWWYPVWLGDESRSARWLKTMQLHAVNTARHARALLKRRGRRPSAGE